MSSSSSDAAASDDHAPPLNPNDVLSIVVIGASGDLAKKKTYPSLLNLFGDHLIGTNQIQIIGYARSNLTNDELRNRLRPFLLKSQAHSPQVVEEFLQHCVYQAGTSYGDLDAFAQLNTSMTAFATSHAAAGGGGGTTNRLFYFAIPPSAFADTASAIKQTGCIKEDSSDGSWTRLVVEKPFGRDLESFEKLNQSLSQQFREEHLYRIDHYLGKELVQNLLVMRFSNVWLEQIWNKSHIQSVILTFKEPFGTDGRGGYFDNFGIIRDILQNHLLQVLTLLAMETPSQLEGPKAGKAIRDAKVAVLQAMDEIQLDNVVLGQYEGYADDPTITNKDTNTPTFCTILLKINTPRWHGVPFILKAGKALNERKAEMRIQFKDAPASEFLFGGTNVPRNELVMRMQPNEAVYLKQNVKSPGFATKPVQSELEVNYDSRFASTDGSSGQNADAYTRLLLDVLYGKQAAFVRDDELRRAWEIFTPVLHRIEKENVRPIVYPQGGRGPVESDDFIAQKAGYVRELEYSYPSAESATSQSTTKATTSSPKITYTDDEKCDIGLFGLAVMGQNFALNMAEHGFKVAVGNRSPAKVDVTVARAKAEGNLPIVGTTSVEDMVARLSKPRKVVILVQAGKPVDSTIAALSQYMEPGDIIIDGGNEWFPNSIRRGKELQTKGINFIGMGISGGEEGARKGPSLMPGGPKEAYDAVAPIFIKCAAQVDRTGPCVGYLGPVGAGNYVKTIHNGIEYGDMQLIAEVYDAMKHVLDMSNEEIADVFEEWNKEELESYLIEITATILRKKDPAIGDGYVVDFILDKTGSKGTGKWTVQEGTDKAVAIPTMAAALDARVMSSQKEERVEASKVLFGPTEKPAIDKAQALADLKAALYASKICSYAQGLSLIKTASDEYNWGVNLSESARLWTGGCIIRAALLDDIQKAFSADEKLKNLMVAPEFAARLNERSMAWRRAIALCITNGVASPALSNSLNYFDTYRRSQLPASLTQAQRDFFGGHTYEHISKEGHFHTAWTAGHKDIGDVNSRIAGEKVQT